VPDDARRSAPGPENEPEGAESNGGGKAPTPRPADETTSALDQTSSDLDQTSSDMDQTASGSDQSGSNRDQMGANADQLASNRDQAAADSEMADHPLGDSGWHQAHEISRAERERATIERGRTTALRARTATERLDYAARRDESARMRDLAARARDRAAEARDRAASELEATLDPGDPARAAHEYARAVRAQAATDRARAAVDRDRAAHDREQANHDLKQAEAEIQHAHIDELTGAYVRGIGTMALQREIDRARHADERLVLAFVDVDELKAVNDTFGHPAGDAVLRDVVHAIRAKLRSYDPIVRVGGDEFICALSGIDLEMGQRRFAEIGEVLRADKDTSISVGFAALKRDDTLADLTARGDAALYQAKNELREAREQNSLADLG
jgi:diguanylate cyclase (GGDEF)-like protein